MDHTGNSPSATAEAPVPSSDAVRAELEKICGSAAFSSASRLKKLLTFLVTQSLAGNVLKESIVGVAVFARDPGYDPKQDSIVRTEVRRLRAKLLEYYGAEGAHDSVLIDLPKGSYAPVFRGKDAPPPVISAPAPMYRLRWPVRATIAAAAVLAVAILVAGYYRMHWARTTQAPLSHAQAFPRRSVAVLDFRNLTARPDSEWLSGAVPELLRADLAAGERIRMVPGENISRMESELSLRPVSSPSRETLYAIRRNLGADVVVWGSYADLGSQGGVRVDIWAQDAQSGDVIASISESGAEPALLDLLSRAGARLRAGLRLEPAAGEVALRSASPQDPAAARDYADGLASLRRGDYLQARDLLLRSVQAEPRFAPAHAALSAAHTALRYDALARREADLAYQLSASLENEQRLATEAQYRAVNHQWARAIEVYKQLFARYPDDIEYGLRLADAQRQASPSAVLQTIEALRRLPAPESGDPRIDIEAAQAYFALSDFHRAAALGADAARKASAVNAKLLYARALSGESAALLNLGDARWEGLTQEARAICAQFGDKLCVSESLRRTANARVIGALDLAGAERDFSEAIRLAREIGSPLDEATALNGMALALGSRGDLRRSIEDLREVVALGRRIPDTGIEEIGLDNLGGALQSAGELHEAGQSLEAALAIARATDHPDGVADELTTLAGIDEIEGDLTASRKACEEAVALARRATSRHQTDALEQKARLLWIADDLDGARQALDVTARLRTSWPDASGRDRLISALVAVAAHKSADAVIFARQAVETAGASHLLHEQARAEAVLAQALLENGQPDDARAAARQAMARVERGQFRLIRLEVSIAHARVTGTPDALPALIAEARARHAYEWELQGRLVAAELARDPKQLAALRTEAGNRGFRYVARQAAEFH
jgi:eukaryotic-like serine/threonine-protein kinase